MARPGLKFAHRLALTLGIANVSSMLRAMTSEDFARWEAYFLLEPFGPRADDVRSARTCAAVANFTANYKKKNGSDWVPADFLPRDPAEPQEPELDGLDGAIVDAFKKLGATVTYGHA